MPSSLSWQSLWGVGTRWPWTSSGSWAQPLPDTLARMRGKKLKRDIPDQQQEPAPGRLSIKRWRRGTLQAVSVSQNHQISTVLKKAGGCSRPPAGHPDTSGFSEDETNVQTGGCSSSSTSWAALSGESNYYSTFSKDCGKEYVIYLLQ